MGVSGLLPCLQSITRDVSLEHYRGLTVAIDAMSWLHKGVFACDVKTLARSQHIDSEKCSSAELRCVKYALDKAEILRAKFGMEVLLVIDGDSLPSKREENAKRREGRENSFEKAVAAEKTGDSRAARKFYAASISVTHKIRYELIKACKQARIAFLVAPFEADAQMARLAHTGVVDLVITEDSDILCYGCPRALFKVDFEACKGQEIQLMRDLGENESLSFKNWTHDMFVFMCILSGCDYCRGVPGIGIKVAHKLVRVHCSPSKIFKALRATGRMPLNFEDEFWVAFRTFRHQQVFCPSRMRIEPLFPIPGSMGHDSSPMEVWPFLGEYIEPQIAARIADGTLHPSKKIAWEEALKTSRDIQINNLSSSPRADRKETQEPRKQINNIWHSLVYGNGSSDERRQLLHQNNFVGPDRDMFRFFSRNSKRDREDVRPPLKEIYVNRSSMQIKTREGLPPPPGHKDLPIHFHEYKSHLVGNTFKPMSRKRIKRMDDGTKSTKCVQKIWEKSSRVPVIFFSEHQDDQALESIDRSADSGGIACFSKNNNPVASCTNLTESRRDDTNAGLFPTYETAVQGNCLLTADSRIVNHRHTLKYLSYDQSVGKESPYSNQHEGKYQYHQENACDEVSLLRRHYEVCHYGDHLGARDECLFSKRHYEKRNGNDDDICDEVAYTKHHQRGPNSCHHYDLKSFSYGYITVEGSYNTECTELEYPAFPPVFDSENDVGEHFDFGHSLQSVLAVGSEQSRHSKKNHDVRPNDYESMNMRVFEFFQSSMENEQSDADLRIEFDGTANTNNPSLEVDNDYVLSERRGRCNRSNTGPLFDDGLLMAFEEMQQL